MYYSASEAWTQMTIKLKYMYNDRSTFDSYKTIFQKSVYIDYRNSVLRFGFSIYQDEKDIENVCKIIRSIWI